MCYADKRVWDLISVLRLPFDAAMTLRIESLWESTGNRFWHDHVLTGDLPKFKYTPNGGETDFKRLPEPVKAEILDRAGQLERDMLPVLIFSGRVKEARGETEGRFIRGLQELLAEHHLDPEALAKQGYMPYSVVNKINEEALITWKHRIGENICTEHNNFKAANPNGALDVEAMRKKLIELGVDVDDPVFASKIDDIDEIIKVSEEVGISPPINREVQRLRVAKKN